VEEEFSSVATKQPIIYNCEGNELIRKLQMKACESEYKVVVIWHPELMGAECSNRVLKSIEEPVGKTLFLLVSDKPDDILPTIQSRTQRVVMHALPEKVLADAIRTKNSNADDNQIQYAARLSKGSIIAAFELLDDGANTFLDTFIRLMRKAYVSDLDDLINLSNELAKLSRKKQISFLQYCQHMIRENFILNVGNTSLNYMTNDENAFSSKFARFINEKNVWQLVEELSKAEFHIERNGMSKIIFYDLALKVMALLKK
jgi:DNA polymerase-3 subunit delta'